MKQHITVEQLKELKGKAASKYVDWMVEKDYDFSVPPSIGQMIEFLDKEEYLSIEKIRPGSHWQWIVIRDNKQLGVTSSQEDRYELCDALWEAVKDQLKAELGEK